MSDSINPHVDKELLVRYLSEETSDLENKTVQQWIKADAKNREHVDQLKLLWEASAEAKKVSVIDVHADWQKVKSKIESKSKVRSIPEERKQRSMLSYLTRVAAVLTFLVVAYLAWPILTSLGPVQMVTVTALNDTSTVALPDGSMVVLNKNSRLVFPEAFEDNVRTVTLEGEAFFDVVKDPSAAFLIKSGNATTEVVGTSFSVNAGIKNKVLVTVVTGEVLLYSEANLGEKLAIIPGEQGQLKNGSLLSKTVNNDINFLSWKTGVLTFKNTPLKKVIGDLSKYYNQSIRLGSSALSSCSLTATFQKESLENVLDELQLVLPIEVQTQNNAVIIIGKGCK